MDVYKAGAIEFRQCNITWVDDLPELIAHAKTVLKGKVE